MWSGNNAFLLLPWYATKPAGQAARVVPRSKGNPLRDSRKTRAQHQSSGGFGFNKDALFRSPRPDASYEARALEVARSQATLGGYRLANLLNARLQ
jgi:hypothetical protein